MKNIKAVLAAGLLMALGPIAANAAPVILGVGGSATTIVCSVDYSTLPAGSGCYDFDNNVDLRVSTGGGQAGSNGAATAALSNSGSLGQASVSANPKSLPVINAQSYSQSNTREQTNFFGFQSYTYGGPIASERTFSGMLDFTQSGGLRSDQVHGVTRAGVAILSGFPEYDAAVSPWGFFGIGLYINIRSFACDEGYELPQYGTSCLAGEFAEYNGPGSFSEILGATTTLQPGQTFTVFAWLQTIGQGGGFADAFSTLNTTFLNEFGQEDLGGINPVSLPDASVPEPTTLALLGLGLVGMGLRRRKVA